MDEMYDVVVIGGGAAGLSGAVALARSRRSVLVLDASDPRNAPAAHVHNFLTLTARRRRRSTRSAARR
jgi:thioredoxin reductase